MRCDGLERDVGKLGVADAAGDDRNLGALLAHEAQQVEHARLREVDAAQHLVDVRAAFQPPHRLVVGIHRDDVRELAERALDRDDAFGAQGGEDARLHAGYRFPKAFQTSGCATPASRRTHDTKVLLFGPGQ